MKLAAKLGLIFSAVTVGVIAGCSQYEGTPPSDKAPTIVFTNAKAIEIVKFEDVPHIRGLVRIRDKETGVVCYGSHPNHLSCTADQTLAPEADVVWNALTPTEMAVELAGN